MTGQRRNRSSKIIATLGPASGSPEKVKKLWQAGADVFRINLSHGDMDTMRAYGAAVRQAEEDIGRPIGILVDLQGPKLRIGTFADGACFLSPGQTFVLDSDTTPGDNKRVHLPHPEIFKAVARKSRLLLDDGKIELVVDKADADAITCHVVVGGRLADRKGVSVPDGTLPVSALTEEDAPKLQAALDMGVDWVALSFVQTAADVQALRAQVSDRAKIIAKIERPAALKVLPEIIAAADGVMVARGDLGVEMPVEDVPGIQKNIIETARRQGKLVIVATQMLESMITSPVPTRAEVSDVANAVYEGADAVMLSAESAVGDYPEEAVAVMNRVCERVETDSRYRPLIEALSLPPEPNSADALTAAATQVAETLSAGCIVCYTTSGSTALRAARMRPRVPILTLTPDLHTARRLCLVWGLHCVLSDDAKAFGDMVGRATEAARAEGFAVADQYVVITAGVPFGTPGKTNILRVARA